MALLPETVAMASLPVLEIDLLRSFTLIAESGSFTRTAERVGRSQSAVSLQVQRLEALVGHRLFLRGKGAIEPGSKGRAARTIRVDGIVKRVLSVPLRYLEAGKGDVRNTCITT